MIQPSRIKSSKLSIASSISQKVIENTLILKSSQLAKIVYDLANSICSSASVNTNDDFSNEFIEEQSYRIIDFISQIPSAFHNFTFTTIDNSHILPFNSTFTEFKELFPKLKDVSEKDYMKAYGVVWIHSRALNEIYPGKNKTTSQTYFLNPYEDELESIARTYLNEKDFISPLLEFAIVDALIHRRILDFGYGVHHTGLLKALSPDQRFYGPLLAGLSDNDYIGSNDLSFSRLISINILKFVMIVFFELIALSITWFIVSAISDESKWILFTGATAGRWICETIRNSRLSDEAKNKKICMEMVWDMTIAHEQVPGMNVKLLQHLLYRLEERGAKFNSSIYDILDKRAKRELQ